MKPEERELILIRPYKAEDHNLVLSTWLKGLRYGNDWYKLIEQNAYYTNYHKAIEAILNVPTTQVLVASLRDDPDTILGYSVLNKDGSVLHWVFVKSAWRHIGIAKLLSQNVKTVTHVTKAGVSILKNHPEVVFNPFLLT
jgi:hypothetical protein